MRFMKALALIAGLLIAPQAMAAYGGVTLGQDQTTPTATPVCVMYGTTCKAQIGTYNGSTGVWTLPSGFNLPGVGPLGAGVGPALGLAANANGGFQTVSVSATAPSTPSLFQPWLNTTATPYVWNIWDGASWVALGTINATTHAIAFPTLNLAATPNGGIGTTLTDIGILRQTCFIGDGSSHVLSTVTSCNGVNTTGYTLVQWQALLPAATALTDEVDWAAIQSNLNGPRTQAVITIPNGSTAVSNHAITAPASVNTVIRGYGFGVSGILFTNATAGQQGITQTPTNEGISLSITDLALLTNADQPNGTAITYHVPTESLGYARPFYFHNLFIGPTQKAYPFNYAWNKGIDISNGNFGEISSNFIVGRAANGTEFNSPPSGTNMQNAIHITATVGQSSDAIKVGNNLILMANKGILVENVSEQTRIYANDIVNVNTGIEHLTAQGSSGDSVENNHVNFYSYGVHLDNVGNGAVRNNLLFTNPVASTAAYGVVLGGGTRGVDVTGNKIHNISTALGITTEGVNVDTTSTDNIVCENYFDGLTTGVDTQASTTNNRTRVCNNTLGSGTTRLESQPNQSTIYSDNYGLPTADQLPTLTANSATPNASFPSKFVRTANTLATTITSFANAVTFGPEFTVQCQDANTTFANSATIYMIGGVNATCAIGDIYKFKPIGQGGAVIQTGLLKASMTSQPAFYTSAASIKSISITGLVAGTVIQRLENGAQSFYYLSASACSIVGGDNISQIAPNSGTGCWLLSMQNGVDARIGGAKFDGVTNDAPGLNAVFSSLAGMGASGVSVKVPSGSSKLGSTLNLPTGVFLDCPGWNATAFTPTAAMTDMMVITGFGNGVRGCQFANASSFAANAIQINKTTNALPTYVEKSYFSSFGTSAIHVEGGDMQVIRDNSFISNGVAVNVNNNGTNIDIGHNYSAGGDGFLFNMVTQGSEGALVHDNTVFGVNYALKAGQILDLHLDKNTFECSAAACKTLDLEIGSYPGPITGTIDTIHSVSNWYGAAAGTGRFAIYGTHQVRGFNSTNDIVAGRGNTGVYLHGVSGADPVIAPSFSSIIFHAQGGDASSTDFDLANINIIQIANATMGGTVNIAEGASVIGRVDNSTFTALPTRSGGLKYGNQTYGMTLKNNSGATITSPATSVTITHGLSYTPALTDLHVNAYNAAGGASQFYVANPTATTFDIVVPSAPATTAGYAWTADETR